MWLQDLWYRAQDAWDVFHNGPEQEIEEDDIPQRTVQRVQPDEYDEDDEEVEGVPVDDEVDELLQEEMHQSAGMHERIVNGAIWCAGVFGTPVLWFILGLGNAQLFANFRALSFDPLIIIAYVFGFTAEFFGIAMILLAGKYAAEKKYTAMVITFAFSTVVALYSFFSQYVLLQDEYSKHLLSFSDNVLQGLPINSHNEIFFIRALLPTILGYAVVFLFANRNPSAVETLRRKRKIQAELNEYKRGSASMKRENVFNDVFVKFEEGFAKDFEYKMGMFAQHGMIVQEHTPIMIEKHTTERLPEQAQSLTPAQQAQPKQFVQPNPNTLAQRVKPVAQPAVKPPVQQPKAVSLEEDDEQEESQSGKESEKKPVQKLPPVQPQQLTSKPPPRPFAKTGGDGVQQQTSRLSDKDAELAKIRSLLQ